MWTLSRFVSGLFIEYGLLNAAANDINAFIPISDYMTNLMFFFFIPCSSWSILAHGQAWGKDLMAVNNEAVFRGWYLSYVKHSGEGRVARKSIQMLDARLRRHIFCIGDGYPSRYSSTAQRFLIS